MFCRAPLRTALLLAGLTLTQASIVESAAVVRGSPVSGGALRIATTVTGQSFNDHVQDVAFSPGSFLVVYHKPTGQTTGHDALCPPNGRIVSQTTFNTDKLDCMAGWAHTRLVAKLVTISDGDGDGLFEAHEQGLSAELPVSAAGSSHPAPTEAARRVDDGASVAFNPSTNEYQVVWQRRFQNGATIVRRLMGRTFTATGGVGPAKVLRVLDEGLYGSNEIGSTDVHYNPVSGGFLVLHTTAKRNAADADAPLTVYSLTDGTLSAITLATKADRARLAYDPERQRFLVVWSSSPTSGVTNVYGRLLGSNGRAIAGKPKFLVAEMGSAATDPHPSYDASAGRWLVTFRASGDIYAASIDGEGNPGARRLVATGPGQRFDPAIAYVPAVGMNLASFGDTDGQLGQGKGYVNVQYVRHNGVPFASRLFLDRAYESLRTTEVAAHPTLNLAAMLRSGVGGVYAHLVQQDPQSHKQACIGPAGGRIDVTSGPLAGTVLTVPEGALDGESCVAFYVNTGDLVPPPSTTCAKRGPSVFVGSYTPVVLKKSIQLKVPHGVTGYDPSRLLHELAYKVVCREPRGGEVGVQYSKATATHARVFLESVAADCQFVHCPSAVESWQKVTTLGSGPFEARLDGSCQALKDADLLGSYDSDGLDYRRLFFVDSVEHGSRVLTASTRVGLHRVWNLWDHEYAAFTSQKLSNGVFYAFPPSVASVNATYVAGLAAGRTDPFWDVGAVTAAFYHKQMTGFDLTFPFPSLPPPFHTKARAFRMVPDPQPVPDTFGLMAGVGIGGSVLSLDLGEGMLLSGASLSSTGHWENSNEAAMRRAEADTALFQRFNIGPATNGVVARYPSFNGGISTWLSYGPGEPRVTRARMVAASLMRAGGGLNPVTNLAAILTMSLANVQQQNAAYPVKTDLDETCVCLTEDCPFSATVTYPDGRTLTRDFTVEPGTIKAQWQGNLFCGRRQNGSIYAKATQAGAGEHVGDSVFGGCSHANRPAYGGVLTERISCCFN